MGRCDGMGYVNHLKLLKNKNKDGIIWVDIKFFDSKKKFIRLSGTCCMV